VIDDPEAAARCGGAPYNDARGAKAGWCCWPRSPRRSGLGRAERKALLQVAVGAVAVPDRAFWILLGRILIRRVSALQLTMRAVEGGQPGSAGAGSGAGRR